MRIHLIGVLKDDADIVGQTLAKAADWADHIYVRDLGSTDGTLDILHDVARRHRNVEVYSDPAPLYDDSLRRDVFVRFRDRSTPGDYWGRFDSDEIFLQDPREVFAAAHPKDDMFWGTFYNFYMTDADAARFDQDPGLYDEHTPIQERMRYYINNWSEPRFVRHHHGLVWRLGHAWPSLVNHCVDHRIRIAHYSYRSPRQIDARLASRWKISATGQTIYCQDILPDFRAWVFNPAHVRDTAGDMFAEAYKRASECNGIPDVTWRDRVIPAADLTYHTPGQPLVDRPDLLPPIYPRSTALTRTARRLTRRALSAVGLFGDG